VRALVVRLSSIGDVVHTLPAASALHAHGWEVGWAVEPAARPLLEAHPALAHVTLLPPARRFRVGPARAAVASLRSQRYDVALDFQGLWKSAAWARLSGAPRVVGWSWRWRREPLSAALARERVELPATVTHVIDENLALLRPLGIDAVGGREFGLPRFQAEGEAVDRGLAQAGVAAADLVILNPGGGWPEKLWPAESFGALARALRDRGLRPLVSWGPREDMLADRVVAASGGAAARCFPTTLRELVELARRARLVVAGDTGPLHLACAVGTPVVGLFGPTDPARNGPFAAADQVLRVPPLAATTREHRFRVASGSMTGIGVDQVMAAVVRRLGLESGARAVAL
jgi:lipopolysaccharide heptosyltransferase I